MTDEDDRTWNPARRSTGPNQPGEGAASEEAAFQDEHAYEYSPDPAPGSIPLRPDDEMDDQLRGRYERVNRHDRQSDPDFSSRLHHDENARVAQALCSHLDLSEDDRESVLTYVEENDFSDFGNRSIDEIILGIIRIVVNRGRTWETRISQDDAFRDVMDSLGLDLTDIQRISKSLKEQLSPPEDPGELPDDPGLVDVIEALLGRNGGFGHDYSDEQAIAVARMFYQGCGDVEIARELGDLEPATIKSIRHTLHLIAKRDIDAIPVELDELRRWGRSGMTTREIAEVLEPHDDGWAPRRGRAIDRNTVDRGRAIISTQKARDRVNDKYVKELNRILNNGRPPDWLADVDYGLSKRDETEEAGYDDV